jgi:hypothetical protein
LLPFHQKASKSIVNIDPDSAAPDKSCCHLSTSWSDTASHFTHPITDKGSTSSADLDRAERVGNA